MESEEADDVFSDSITEDATAADILLLFLKEQKKELLRKKYADTGNLWILFWKWSAQAG